MQLTGQWHNPEYAGEGLTSIEYADGKVVAYFFTYHDDGDQRWFVCVGDRGENDVVTLTAYETFGGVMGDPDSLASVTENRWGTIELSVNSNDKLQIEFKADAGASAWTYELSPLYEASIPAALPAVRITRQRLGRTQELAVPLESTMADAPATYTLHVENAPIKIEEAYAAASSPAIEQAYRPTLTGLAKGETLQPGEYIITCGINSGWKQHGYESHRVNYVIVTRELGMVFNLSLPVKSP